MNTDLEIIVTSSTSQRNTTSTRKSRSTKTTVSQNWNKLVNLLKFVLFCVLYLFHIGNIGSSQSHNLCHGGGIQNGYIQRSQSQKKRRNSEVIYNYVDRVRINEPNAVKFDKSGQRRSGWRQRSLSNLELSTGRISLHFNLTEPFKSSTPDVKPAQITHKSDNNLYEDFNSKYSNNYLDKTEDSCKLRRTQSLAVICEETYNDLHISGINLRRSQLIPRAKLVNKPILSSRGSKTNQTNENQEYYSGSDIDLNTYETLESECHVKNGDKSDLDSINSDYFKNSSHQESVSTANKEHFTEIHEKYLYKKSSYLSEHHQSFIEVTAEDEIDEHLQLNDDDNFSNINDGTDSILDINILDEIIYAEANSAVHKKSVDQTSVKETINTNTLTIKRCTKEGNDLTRKLSKRSIISYDSIYLSSEGGSGGKITPGEDTFYDCADPLDTSNEQLTNNPKEFIKPETITKDDSFHQPGGKNNNTTETVDNNEKDLYSQITRPRVIAVNPKKTTNLTSFSDITNRGTLERLTFLTSTPSRTANTTTTDHLSLLPPQILQYGVATSEHGLNQHLDEKNFGNTINTVDNKYCSLPDINISKSLRASERIDEKLRQSYLDTNQQEYTEYDTISATEIEQHTEHELNEPTNYCSNLLKPIVNITKSIQQNDSNCGGIDNYAKGKINETTDCTTIFTELNQVKLENTNELNSDNEPYRETVSDVSPQDSLVDTVNPVTPDKYNNFQPTTASLDSEIKPNFNIKHTDTENFYKSDGETYTDDYPERDTLIEERQVIHNTFCSKAILAELKSHDNSTTTAQTGYTGRTKTIFKGKPLRTYSQLDLRCLKDNRIAVNKTLTYKIKVKEHSYDKMSRPQIIHVIDSKRNRSQSMQRPNVTDESLAKDKDTVAQEPYKNTEEFQQKVDAIRDYWSKLIDDKKDSNTVESHYIDETTHSNESQKIEVMPLNLSHDTVDGDLQSYNPYVDILETKNSNKLEQAFSSHNNSKVNLTANEQKIADDIDDDDDITFDHVRYKVIKSDTFKNNILLDKNRKEAQFDGLLQYLRDYSFQELLSNKNVVIIEPVRTKIEKASNSVATPIRVNCKITGGSGANTTKDGSKLKRHFFYHPIRVNKELIDEELPNPDTVRKVRELFEETLRLKSPYTTEDNQELNKRKTKRTLTIDTIDNGTNRGQRKWDSASISSGVSSADLSSPCGYNDNDGNKYSSEENLCDDDLCKSYYVSQDILEKIRECGSSVTYYGGRVVNNKSVGNGRPMTQSILQEIRGQENSKCGVCQPDNCPLHMRWQQTKESQDSDDNSLGFKFTLVKSNSCSSRLELAGKGDDDLDYDTVENQNNNNEPNGNESVFKEEYVKTLINRLESGAINQSPIPRIIESGCIEKVTRTNNTETVTINNQPLADDGNEKLTDDSKLVDLITKVTVNNHINFLPSANQKTVRADENFETARFNQQISYREMGRITKSNRNNSIESTNHNLNGPQILNEKMGKNNGIKDAQSTIKFIDSERKNSISDTVNLIKTSTVNKKDDEIRNYIANDRKLIEKPKYDEIEFEEFEVAQPGLASDNVEERS